MRIASRLGSVPGASAALAMLAACSGGSGSSQPALLVPQQQAQRSSAQSVAGRNLPSVTGIAAGAQTVRHGASVKGFFSREALAPRSAVGFISDINNNVVYVLNAKGVVIGTLTGFSSPDGMSVDKAGNLYVANNGASNVLEFAPPYNGTPKVINDPGEYPVMVAVDANGNLAVSAGDNTSGEPGDVALYTAGATSPTNTVSEANVLPFFCAFDAGGNLYVDGLNLSTGVTIGEIVGGVSGTSISPLTFNNTLQAIGGVQVTKTGEIAVDDQVGKVIYSYNPPTGGSLGSPVATTSLAGSQDPVNFALIPGNARVVTADNGLGQAQLYKFPAGGSPIATSSLPAGAGPIGAAINPTAQFAQF